MFALRETSAADNNPEPGRQYLRDTFGQGYWGKREGFVLLLEWLAALGNTEGMTDWVKDSGGRISWRGDFAMIMRSVSCTPEEIHRMRLTLDIPESALASLQKAPKEFAQELRIAAAVKWYEVGRFSQGRAAEIAGLTRSGFIEALSRYKVTPFQYTAEDLAEELADAD